MCNVIDVETQDDLRYVFFPVTSGALRFKVKATNDAHIALTNGDYESDPMTEIHIGGWDNTKSIVRRNRSEPDKVKVETPNILNSFEYVGMWIQWHSGYIAAGLQGSDTPFISYQDPAPHPIDHVAVRTGWGSTGSWKIEVSPVHIIPPTPKQLPEELTDERDRDLHWVKMSSNDELPPDAVVGGFEDGEIIYVARAMHNGSVCPGKYVPSLKHAFIPWGHQSRKTGSFEVLCGYNLMWVKTERDRIPPNAFPGGISAEAQNETLYIGRAYTDLNLIPGRVHMQCQSCYIPYDDTEREVERDFEILVIPDQIHRMMISYSQPTATRPQENVGIFPYNSHRRRRPCQAPRIQIIRRPNISS